MTISKTTTLYDQDFNLWIEQTVHSLYVPATKPSRVKIGINF